MLYHGGYQLKSGVITLEVDSLPIETVKFDCSNRFSKVALIL